MTVQPAREDYVARLRQELLGDCLTVSDVAAVLGMDRTTVMRFLRTGTLEGFKIGRQWHIPEKAVRAWLQRCRQGGAA